MSSNKYLPQEFEKKLIELWEKDGTYTTKEPKENKKYVLVMFPYPSGEGLHVGHVRPYTGTDILARYYRMKGFSVLHPMGWDAFGLPAENAAIKAKKNPQDMVPKNIANFKRQMKMLGLSYDWNREFSTTDPNYYKWTQWLFIQFFKMGLLYKRLTPVYYCEFCKTGLAEEEVLANGTHERCGNPITRKELPQWIFKIRSYADRLLKDLGGLDWPKGILDMQRNWIGRKEGLNIAYPVEGTKEEIICFTTRADTNFGATFIVLAPEHDFVKKLLSGQLQNSKETDVEKVKNYVDRAISKTDLERISEGKKKTGVFTGFYAKNRLNNKLMPIWISDFVLSDVGTGAVVGVPGHDARDFEFAKEFGLEVVKVVDDKKSGKSKIEKKEDVFEGEGVNINSDFLDGLESREAIKKVTEFLEKKGWARTTTTYHLRDWIFSRQRYWGEPIPMVFCQKCKENGINWWQTDDAKKSGQIYQNNIKIDQAQAQMLNGWFPLTENQLPLELPYLESYEVPKTGGSPLENAKDWVKTTCPNCGSEAKRETDTMPNWAGSCWYFLRFPDPDNDKEAFSKALIKKWLPVDWYIGGAEHAVLHLLYARFWIKALFDLKLVDFREPFSRLRSVGVVIAEDHKRMSKSRGNVINPDDVVKEFGADALRIYEMFMAPFSQEIAWSTQNMQGGYRFLKRIWHIYNDSAKRTKSTAEVDKQTVAKLQSTLSKVEADITDVKYNTAVSTMMEFLNSWEKQGVKISEDDSKNLLKVLAPFAPFITEEIWREVFKEKDSIHLSSWPKTSKVEKKDEEVNIPVQIDGKVRTILNINQNETDEKKVVSKALENERVSGYLKDKKYKTIYKKGRVLSFVTS